MRAWDGPQFSNVKGSPMRVDNPDIRHAPLLVFHQLLQHFGVAVDGSERVP
jgi:hypothetical protein